MALLLDHLALDAPAQTGEGGAPLLLPIDAIDEDPDQPRREFDADALDELAHTIAARGVRQPVSVRPHPKLPGRWMLNFGARRLRASRLAGKAEIPAFLDATADSYDQVLENEQREGLKPMELALFVQRELAAGMSQADVARRLGKSRAYLSYVCALIDAPHWLLNVYREGRCHGVRELYDLRRLHRDHPAEVLAWLATREFISRGDVTALQGQLSPQVTPASASPATKASQPATERPELPLATGLASHHMPPAPLDDRPKLSVVPSEEVRPSPTAPGLSLRAEFGGSVVRVWLHPVPASPGTVWVSSQDGPGRRTVAVGQLTGLHLVWGMG